MTIETTRGAQPAPTTIAMRDLPDAIGRELGPGPWLAIDQDRIDGFARATGDHQWIHIDVERAAAGPFGRTIAHGYLTLSMVPQLLSEILDVTGRGSGVNYGIDRVRFISPVAEGSRIRMRGRLADAVPRGEGVQYRLELVIELEGSERPAMAGEFIVLALP
ncbi:MaoC family dehydratase [Actinomadura viridis]|uniref:MaoC family dehydratase n=1 Tax=Actinomadura viridis TaxID=58110 RepID=UPI0036AD314D